MSATIPAAPVVVKTTPTSRIESIDLVRGAVMILMGSRSRTSLFGIPPGGPTPGVFFNALDYALLRASIYFPAGPASSSMAGSTPDASSYLLIRGAWLICRTTFLRVAWTSIFDFRPPTRWRVVIWVIGWCMILIGCTGEIATGLRLGRSGY